MRTIRLATALVLLLLAAGPAHAQTTILTESWNSANSNWTVAAGTPAYGSSRLRNAASDYLTISRLLYAGALTDWDYSVQSWVGCGSDGEPNGYYPIMYHYLRASGGNHYRVQARCIPQYDGSVNVELTLNRILSPTAPPYSAALGYTVVAGWGGGDLKTLIVGSTITVSWQGSAVISASDAILSTGSLGVGTGACSSNYSSGLFPTTLAYAPTTLPTAPTGLAAAPYATQVNLSWNSVTGATGYEIWRDNNFITSVPAASYQDLAVLPNTTYAYKVRAFNDAGNSPFSAVLNSTTPLYTYAAPDIGGAVEYAAGWGAGPERIALLTGALNLRFPLQKLQQRGGPGFNLAASWNSQFWEWDSTGTRMKAMDTGYGLGFNFMFGGVYPVYSGSALVRFVFQDAGGVIRRLEVTGTANQYKSADSTYLLWDNALRKLYFNDGSVWTFDCVSRWPEPDAGTRYPTELKDRNGNFITVVYNPAQTWADTNTSARIKTVRDTVTLYTWTYSTVNGSDHVTRIFHSTGEAGATEYTDIQFTYTTRTDIVSPFTAAITGQPLTAAVLSQITFTGSPGPYLFAYNTSAEITKVTLPYKGWFRYDYATASFSNPARQTREIWKRYLASQLDSGGNALDELTWEFQHNPSDPTYTSHTQAILLDPPGNKQVWYFTQGTGNLCTAASRGWDNGLSCRQETYQGPSSAYALKLAVDNDWTQDNPAANTPLSNPRVSAATSTATESGVSVQSKREQSADSNGNVTVVKEYGYGDLANPYRTTAITYETGSNYTSLVTNPLRYILNMAKETRVCAGASTTCATPESLATITYDANLVYYSPPPAQWDAAYGSILYRGNLTSVNANGMVQNTTYDGGGNVMTQSVAGSQISSAGYDSSNYTQLTSLASGAATRTLVYNTDLTTQKTTGTNNDTTNFYYASYRPSSTRLPDGSVEYYSYSDGGSGSPWTYPFQKTTMRTGTTLPRKIETYDGLGRVIKTQIREAPAWGSRYIVTETQYTACSCGPVGKAVKVSRPYWQGTETAVWTETHFDALGRPTEVIPPDHNTGTPPRNSKTTYTYSIDSGLQPLASSLVTAPLSKQKRYLNDAFGRLLRVEEQNAGGTLVETARYTYDYMGRMTKVQMGKINETTFKQTRTFVYNTKGQLLSATNPENGTVNYTYLANGLVQSQGRRQGADTVVQLRLLPEAVEHLLAARNREDDLPVWRWRQSLEQRQPSELGHERRLQLEL